jgi:hypothetical protein
MSADNLMDDTDEESEKNDDLKTIFGDTYCTKYQDEKGNRKWKCGWCDKDFSSWNATKALQHLTKQTKVHIQPCKGKISDEYIQKYRLFFDKSQKKRKRLSKNNESVRRLVDGINESATAALQEHRYSLNKKRISDASSFTQSTMFSDKRLNVVDLSTASNDDSRFIQMKIHDGPNPNAELKLTMAVADLIHSCGLPFKLASHPKFRKVITLAKAVGTSYKLPSRNQVATDLLDTNYDIYVKKKSCY